MPNLGVGGTQHVNLTYTPTWIYTPNASAVSNIELFNEGRNTVYVGQADVTVNTGLPIPPNSGPVKLTNVLTPLYAISQITQGAVAGTVGTTGTAGTSVIAFGAAASSTVLTVGQTLLIGSTAFTSNQEAVSVASTTGTTNVTLSSATQFAHDTTNVIYSAVPTFGQIRVNAGVL